MLKKRAKIRKNYKSAIYSSKNGKWDLTKKEEKRKMSLDSLVKLFFFYPSKLLPNDMTNIEITIITDIVVNKADIVCFNILIVKFFFMFNMY